ncbi:MAG: hypothetical protein JW891_02300 [Candidatus Lokiarchaeota archaeon]|nr:hypothetical protein [Candidatus Lokiarchaeota archaeon]
MSKEGYELVESSINQKVLYSFLAIMFISFCIGIITSVVRLVNGVPFGHDFRYYYIAVNRFWMGQDIYEVEGYLYLNYFCVLCVWMLLPEYLSFTIHLMITFGMFFYILKNVKNSYQEWWLYGNILMVFWWSMLFNTNIWITFSLYMYQKYKDKWFAPLFLLLAFYKLTSIIAFGILFLINLYFERKLRKEIFPALILVLGIVLMSFITSSGVGGNVVSYNDMLIFLQVPHYFWWSVPILVFIEYKKYPINKVKWFWILFCTFEIVLCLAFLPLITEGIETFVS